MEFVRDGDRSVAELMDIGKQLLGRYDTNEIVYALKHMKFYLIIVRIKSEITKEFNAFVCPAEELNIFSHSICLLCV